MAHISKGTPNAHGRNVGEASFLSTLSYATLLAARAAVRRQHLREFGRVPEWLTDRECDRIIEAMGPEAMDQAHRDEDDEKMVQKARRRLEARGMELPTIAVRKRPGGDPA